MRIRKNPALPILMFENWKSRLDDLFMCSHLEPIVRAELEKMGFKCKKAQSLFGSKVLGCAVALGQAASYF
jgi:hypothetical protein